MASALGWSMVAWLAAVNAATCLAFASDKRRAREGEQRISERALLIMAALGGTPAAFVAQRRLRHKTRKQPFAALLMMIAVVQLMVIALAVYLR
jgi:uncharacterized membrane protein YsdA (DUF1294 family)